MTNKERQALRSHVDDAKDIITRRCFEVIRGVNREPMSREDENIMCEVVEHLHAMQKLLAAESDRCAR